MGWLDDLAKKNSQNTGNNEPPANHYCWHCAGIIPANQFHRQDTCDHCHRASHCCKNCDFYDVSFNNHCRESSAERVVDKESSNFCDYFKPSTRGPGAGSKAQNSLKNAAESLFKKK